VTMRIVRAAIWIATAICVATLFLPLVQEMLRRLQAPPDPGLLP